MRGQGGQVPYDDDDDDYNDNDDDNNDDDEGGQVRVCVSPWQDGAAVSPGRPVRHRPLPTRGPMRHQQGEENMKKI